MSEHLIDLARVVSRIAIFVFVGVLLIESILGD